MHKRYCIVIYTSIHNFAHSTVVILEKELCSFSTQGDILIGGDFSFRLGKKYKDIISFDSKTHLPVDPSDHLNLVLQRNFKDKNNNSYGKLLSELCLTHNLMILNGRTMGDFTGKYIHIFAE